jgi:hypothetical protein
MAAAGRAEAGARRPGVRPRHRGLDAAPQKKASVSLVLQDNQSYYKLPKEQQFPGPIAGRKAIIPSIARHTQADDEGRFEFYAGPGEYQLRSYSDGNQPAAFFALWEEGQYTLTHYDRTQLTELVVRRRTNWTRPRGWRSTCPGCMASAAPAAKKCPRPSKSWSRTRRRRASWTREPRGYLSRPRSICPR